MVARVVDIIEIFLFPTTKIDPLIVLTKAIGEFLQSAQILDSNCVPSHSEMLALPDRQTGYPCPFTVLLPSCKSFVCVPASQATLSVGPLTFALQESTHTSGQDGRRRGGICRGVNVQEKISPGTV
uniref:Uncharacterized protein n=1 Tax=Bionectria ochroleuca TaxID=29856 RepID=A0A8H7NDR0_BIOOC